MRSWLTAAVVGLMTVGVVLTPTPVLSHRPITTTVMFNKEIAQIFQRKCFQCHSDNNVAMSLTTYTAARPWARAIREEILDREMPPWRAVRGYGHFANDISLNAREMEIILSWTDGGAPSGVLRAEESTPPVYVASQPLWDHGEPDLVLPLGDGHAVASGSAFEIKRFVVQTKLPAATRVRAIALKQGDRRVVRHAAFYDASSGQWLGAWTPWQTLSQFPQGVAVRLSAKARVAVEIGYSGAEEDVVDTSELGFYFADDAAGIAAAAQISATTTVAAGATGSRARGELAVREPTRLLAFWPDPGDGATSVEITWVAPDGMATPLLFIDAFDPLWRSPYYFDAPIEIPRRSRVVMTTYFDNDGGAEPLVAKPRVWMATAAPSRPASSQR